MTNSRDYIEKHIKAIRIRSLECSGFRTWIAKLNDGSELAIDAETQEQAIGHFQNWRDRRDSITTEATTYSFPARTLVF